MKLYLNGQDINRLVIADLDKPDDLTVIEVGPEEYLKEIDRFLSERDLYVRDLEEVYNVIGPGSATSLRAIISIVNTIKMLKPIKVFAIEKDKDEHDIDTVSKIVNKKVALVEQDNFLAPIYESGPKITVSTKDRLKRDKVIKSNS